MWPDMMNVGGRAAGTITAGLFLARFASDYPGRTWISPARNSPAKPTDALSRVVLALACAW